jgi:hypothetical protein
VRRHPTQLYEAVFLLALCAVLERLRRTPHREGARFRLFLTAYLVFGLAVDFLEPDPRFAGLSSIQWACLAALCWYARDRASLTGSGRTSSTTPPFPSVPPISGKSKVRSSSRKDHVYLLKRCPAHGEE